MHYCITLPARRINLSRARAPRGFSLLELMVALVVLSVIGAAVVPVFSGSVASMRVRAFQSDFIQIFEYIQERAVTDVREYRLYIDEREHSYWAMRHTGYDDRQEKVFEMVEQEWGQLRHFPDTVRIERMTAPKDRERDARYMACYPNGSCTRVKVNLTESKDRRRRVIIETTGVMGKVEVDDYRDRRR